MPAKMMSDDDIRDYARAFSSGIVGTCADMKCFMVSAPLASFLCAIGVQCECVEGRLNGAPHFWVEFQDGRIIDATAKQFGLRNVWLKTAPAGYKKS